MDTTRKGLHTGCFIQVGGNTSQILSQHCESFIQAEIKSVTCTKGPTHRHEITPPLPEPELSQSALRLADLTSEEEGGLHGRISQYERKIDSLLTEVSSLKNEVSFYSVCTSLIKSNPYTDLTFWSFFFKFHFY